VGAAYLRDDGNAIKDKKLTIRSLAVEIADRVLLEGEDGLLDNEAYLRTVYRQVKAWVKENSAPRNKDGLEDSRSNSKGILWIILDDVSSLATILGDNQVYCFVDSLLSFLPQTENCGVIVRSSYDLDQSAHKNHAMEELDHSGWLGAGGLAQKHAVKELFRGNLTPWERNLEASVDAIVDVLPLPSGFSREAHGRLIFSETPTGRGWIGANISQQTPQQSKAVLPKVGIFNNWNRSIVNYCVQDTGVRAIRLRRGC